MSIDEISLSDEERALLAQVNLEGLFQSADDARGSGDAACLLMRSLIERHAIPQQRVRYFTDPEYNIGGRGSSRADVFERNGTRNDDIFRHPNFLKYLRYFLYGARLPRAVIERFSEEVSRCEPLTSGDLDRLQSIVRCQVRLHNLPPRDAAVEFYKLALDCGMSPDFARYIRDAVLPLR